VLAGGGDGLVSALEALAVAFAVTVALYLFKVVGAGDSKLFAAAALFVGLQQLPAFALATVLFGGVIAVISLATRPTRALVMIQMGGKGDYGRGIPYGVAIAFGAIVVIWGTMLGLLPHVFGGGRINAQDITRALGG
jgi:prepilin peptidase CpaA